MKSCRVLSRKDERGAVLVIATVGIVLAMIASALAVDLGRVAQDKRTDQKIADLAALDASRNMGSAPAACLAAQSSAARNGFPGLSCSDVVLGYMDATGFHPGGAMDAVQVRIGSAFKAVFPFVSGPSTVTAKAVASNQNLAGFSLGSGVGSFDSNRSTLMNRVLGQMLCTPTCATGDASLALASWQGLAAGKVNLEVLRQSMLASGFAAGSVDQMLSTDMTLAQFYTVTANALRTGGDTANASVFDALAVKATSAVKIQLNKLIKVEQGAENAALASSVNLYQLVSGTAEVANGNHTIDVSDAGVTVGGITSTKVRLTVIEPPVIFFGAYGDPAVSTAQVDVTVTPSLNLTIPLVARIGGDLPIKMTGGKATASLAATPACPTAGNKSFQVSVSTDAGDVTQTASVNVYVALTGTNLGLLNITGDIDVAASGPTSLPAFVEQGTTPQTFVPASQHHGGTSLGLGAALSLNSGVPAINALLSGLLGGLKPVLNTVDANIVQPLLTGLGLDLGTADVLPLTVMCGVPGLVG